MAILGGAGNVAGSNPAGTGSSLNYIGDHAYANSGTFGSTNANQTMLSFVTGNSYVVGELTLTGGTEFTSAGIPNGNTTAYQLSFNDQVVAVYKIDSNEEDSPSFIVAPLLLEPFTKVEVLTISSANNTEDLISANFVGRVY